ncbi:hypothetical protein Glove_272g43 [Diversispora epigaea]|uniref:Uncharacterized protein n=1 Tax=Diversispora epigaea TaxID=1348612 RepID=A0A397I5Z5_9GLOM|nr:hypothetical protein Glove_272g43 [Diversispora epigaea]
MYTENALEWCVLVCYIYETFGERTRTDAIDQCILNALERLYLIPDVAPLIIMQVPATLAAALEKAQAYEEGLDMVNEMNLINEKLTNNLTIATEEITVTTSHKTIGTIEIIETTEITIEKLVLVSNVERKDISLGTVLIAKIIPTTPHIDDSSDEDIPIKRPREINIPESKSSLNTFGLPKTTSVPVPKVVKTEITPKKKSKKKELQNQSASLSWADALEVPSIRKSFFEALRKPKEKEIKLADQEYSLKTNALKCNVAVGVYTMPTIVDSGAAISIVTRDAMEQLGYKIEEASISGNFFGRNIP